MVSKVISEIISLPSLYGTIFCFLLDLYSNNRFLTLRINTVLGAYVTMFVLVILDPVYQQLKRKSEVADYEAESTDRAIGPRFVR